MTPIRKQDTKQTTQKALLPEDQSDQSVDTAAIALALKKNPRWIEAMRTIADYKRSQLETSAFNHRRAIKRKAKHTHWTYSDLKEVYDVLQEAGAGEIKVRPNKEPVFRWYYYAKDIAKNAIALSKKTVEEIKAAPRAAYGPPVVRPHLTRKREVTSVETAPAVTSSTPSVSKPIRGDVIVVQLRGIEFELDLSQVPMELLKPRRIL